MRKHLAYLKYVARHKWYVFHACLELGVPLWQALIHDWHKFLPDEWLPYLDYFYGDDGDSAAVRARFSVAWLKHQNRAPHHWQYWVRINDDGTEDAIAMPDRYRREMLADWRGAGLAIDGEADTLSWYTPRRDGIRLHPETRVWLEREMGYEGPTESDG